MRINPYLAFDGHCAEAFAFYAKALGGTIDMMMTWGESPMADRATPETKGRIIHASLSVGGHTIMGGDAPPTMYKKAEGFCVSLGIDDEAQAQRVFKALSEGGTVGMPMQETFWAKAFGMVTDRFGTPWMVNCAKPM